MRTVQLEVTEDTAQKIEQLSRQEKEELAQAVNLWVQDRRTLRAVMDDISTYAQQQGLTPDILDQLLREE